ncbi:hypothetical protein B0H19DRAFT_1196664 [Mycena capillaripes]|nr:hypothetical protein B0H19DRAFT_1196664 [Mycena capillaripes]
MIDILNTAKHTYLLSFSFFEPRHLVLTMSLDPIADPGYESDTGERDNPTCANFEANQPVQQVIGFFPGKKALNRKGRAICRIMAAHGWAHKDIATIFHISAWSVSRAITNVRYTPRDRIEEDYARVDSEFLEKYPPIPQYNAPKSSAVIYIDTSDDENDPQAHGVGFGDEGPSSSARPQRTAKVLCRSLIKDLADDEDDGPVWNPLIDLEEPDVPTTSQKRIHEHSSAPVTSNPNGGVQESLPTLLHRNTHRSLD